MGVSCAHKEQFHFWPGVRELCDGVYQGQRIKPVIDATAPDHDFVALADSGHHPAKHSSAMLGLLIGKTEGDHADEPFQVRIVFVNARGDATQRRELAQVEMALTLGRAQEVVTHLELVLDGDCRIRYLLLPLSNGQMPRLFQLLQMHRVINISNKVL